MDQVIPAKREQALALELSGLLGKGPAPLLGLDISSSSIKLVELSRKRGGQVVLDRYALEPLPRGAVVDGNIEKIEDVTAALQRALRRLGTRAKEVAMALPPTAVITKRILLPADLSEAEMEAQIESEAVQYIPFSLEEVSLDFNVLGPSAATPGDVDVLIAAARREKVEDRVAIAQSVGLKPVIMDVESYASRLALERVIETFPDGGRDMLFAVFSIGATTTSATVLLNGEAVYEREQSFGGAQLTQDIARAYGLSLEEAETKKRAGDLPEGYERDLLQPFAEVVALEVTRALQFFYTATPYNRVDQVLLAGGCSLIAGLPDVVSARTQLPVESVNPFLGMELGPAVRERQLRAEEASLLVGCGLALRRFDR